jgi:hypothetical protein
VPADILARLLMWEMQTRQLPNKGRSTTLANPVFSLFHFVSLIRYDAIGLWGASMRRWEFLEVQRDETVPSRRHVPGNNLSATGALFRRPAMLLLFYSSFWCCAGDFARAQPLSFAELEGSRVEVIIFREQINHFNNNDFRLQIDENWLLEIGPSEWLSHTTTAQARGRPTAPTNKGTFQLGIPREVSSVGGGIGLWSFNDNTLVWTRTFIEGAYRLEISFTRKEQLIECSAKQSYARENGGKIVMWISGAGANGANVETKSWRQISSKCQMLKS